MTSTDVMRQMWPNLPLPPSLLLESGSRFDWLRAAFYLELKAFELVVASCPASIFRYNSILRSDPSLREDADACNVLQQPLDRLDEESLRYF